MNDTTEILYAINRRLEDELGKLNHSRNVTLFLGTVLLCVVSGYLYFLNAQAAPYANANNMANIMALEISKAVPGIIASSKGNVIKMLPGMAGRFKAEVYKSMVAMRIRGNLQLVRAIAELFSQVDILLKEEIRKQGSPYREKIVEKLKALSDPARAQGELEGLDAVMETVIFGEVDRELKLGLNHLQKIEKEITQALEKEGVRSEQDQLIKKFIVYWVNFYEHDFKMK